MRLFQQGGSDPTNIGNPTEVTVGELAELVLQLTDSRSPIEYRELPVEDPQVRCPDIAKAKADLGWEPWISLQDGLKRTIEYFKTSLQH